MTTQADLSSARRLRRLYSDRDISSLDQVLLSAEESHHAIKVLRLQPGELCLIVDGSGCEAESRPLRLEPPPFLCAISCPPYAIFSTRTRVRRERCPRERRELRFGL